MGNCCSPPRQDRATTTSVVPQKPETPRGGRNGAHSSAGESTSNLMHLAGDVDVPGTRDRKASVPEPEPEEEKPHESDDEKQEEEEVKQEQGDTLTELPKLDVPAKFQNRSRRRSVSAESDAPEDDYVPKVIPKTEEALKRIKAAVSKSFLFNNLNLLQQQKIFDAMEEKKVKAGDEIITIGKSGDYFYVVDSGRFEVFDFDQDHKERKLWTYTDSGSFGEIALMYNCPRRATVRAATDGVLWSVDRQTFRNVLVVGGAKQREIYKKMLEHIPLLQNLSPIERANFADCLVPMFLEAGRVVIEQGQEGDKFYIVEQGEAVVKFRKVVDGEVIEEAVRTIKAGDYFGEVALIANQPRNAMVYAAQDLKLAVMDRKHYDRLVNRLYMN